ncbi:EF-hand domain-containing protein [Ekhidna sp.]|uniref:EF-hand domain-containing protein n=1 Tax=Ekhidna sp. TaxID=2608089 RepID=UPI003B501CB0
MLTDFQKEKISHYFHVVLDQDRNGVLEENDFREIGESLCVLWMFKPGTKEYEEVIDKNIQSWNMFKKYFQKQKGEANEEQFLRFFDVLLKPGNEEVYKRWVKYMISSIFDSFDVNEDGVMSVDEYSDMFMCYHIPIKHSARAFVKLDRDGDDSITKKELIRAVDEFFRSNDENSPGNWLFGFWGDKD